ncbi:MAG: NADH-quinone oxidoreductase subunit L [Planctomycetota bacterium]|nr:MAG: NADH-quinone oxidoreductase subunit L [Planctomycetota bacterium]
MLALASADLLPNVSLFATIPFWPLLGAIVVGLLIATRGKTELAHWPVVGGVAVSAALSIYLFFTLGSQGVAGHDSHADAGGTPAALVSQAHGEAGDASHAPASDAAHGDDAHHAPSKDLTKIGVTYKLYDWISFGQRLSLDSAVNQWIAVSFFFDRLTGMMMLFVTVVSLMVVIYAIGYMRDHHGHPERGYERFFAFLGLFVFSMAMLVLAGNFVLLYLGWELVGLCSYLLIGFYYQKPSAAAAAKKAFIVNRIGDFGFALGIFTLYMFIQPHCAAGENPLDYATVFKYVGHLSEGSILGMMPATLIALLLMCGAIGKSAQFPLYVWLPDAMEGPTPVSALIHAATMVTAGIYMIARCGPIFSLSPAALETVAILGAIGALLTATMAMAQYDMKRILAYSTISQLAYMFVALGVGAPDSAVFHVFTHAWFKALLFLCAGSVMHAMGNIIDLRQFSGLRTIMPVTRWLMLIGCLTLAGFPLLSGFWSKDEIVHAALNHNTLLGVVMLITAGLTAYYTFRMYFLCFHGPTRVPPEAGEHPHEAPPVMLRPLYVLAAGSIFLGILMGVTIETSADESFLGFLHPRGYFHAYLAGSTIMPGPHHAGGIWVAYLSAVIAIAGIGLAWMRYGQAPVEDPDRRALGPVFELWHNKYWVDELYDRVFVRPLRGLGHICFGIDRFGVDGLVWFVSFIPRMIGGGLRYMHRGALQGYALSMVVGLAVLMLIWRWASGA